MNRPVVARLRDGTPVAGWLCKANPEVWDVESHLAEHGRVDRWRLMHSYRVDLVHPGHPIVIWLTGARAGVIAVGTVTARPAPHPEEEGIDGARPHVDVDCVAVDPVPKHELLRDLGFSRTEVVRTPRSGNPLVLTPEELDIVADHLEHDPWT